MLIYTSGSTGEPKGIVYDHTHLLHGAWFWAQDGPRFARIESITGQMTGAWK